MIFVHQLCNPLPAGIYVCLVHGDVESPTLPLLPTHGNQAIKQFLTQRDRRQLPRLARFRHNLQPISDSLVRRPAHHQLRLPADAANLLQLADVVDGDAEHGTQFLLRLVDGALGDVGREGDAGDGGGGGDVDPALGAGVAGAELDGAGDVGLVGGGQDAEVVAGVGGAGGGADAVGAELGVDAGAREALDEAEDLGAGFGLAGAGRLRLGLLGGGGVDGVVDIGVRGVEREVVLVEGRRLVRRGLIGTGRRWKRCLLGLAEAQ